MFRPALGLSLGLALAFAPLSLQAERMTDAERAALHAEIRAYLLENPEVLVEAMDVLSQRRDQAMIDEQTDTLFASTGDWVGGNPQGDVTLVEFMDYRCGYCRKSYAEIEDLVKADGNIRFIVKEFPILGDASVLSAQFAIAVLQLHGDEAYKTVHDKLITLRGEPTADTLSRLAIELSLDPQPILTRMNTPEVMSVIQANHALAEAMEINGTPAFVTQNGIIRGYAPLQTMQNLVANARTGG